MERLQRVLAAAGIASRRRAEELILEGRVRVDGEIITELGTRVDASAHKIEVDGKLIPTVRRRYILLNKPSGYITTTSDERSRYTVMDLVPVNERVVPVGRLDRQTEGLLLLTNDGEVAHRVMHPRYGIDKEYEALLDGYPPPDVLDRLRRGITIDGQRTSPEMIRPIRNTEDGTIVRIVIHEGRNRIVRKMFDEVGYPVIKLIRTRVGPLQLGAIPRGTFRDLTDGELNGLREALHLTDEDVSFAAGVVDRPMRDRPDPNRMKTGRERASNAQRAVRGPAGAQQGRRDDRGRGPSGPRRDAQQPGPPRPSRDGQYAGPPQARRGDNRSDDVQRGPREERPARRPTATRDSRDGERKAGVNRPAGSNDSRRTSGPGSGAGKPDRSQPSGPSRGGSRPTGPAGQRRGPGGPKRGSNAGPGSASRGKQQGPGAPREPQRRNKPASGSGGGGDRPPDSDRDRRASGGGQEHGRGDGRKED